MLLQINSIEVVHDYLINNLLIRNFGCGNKFWKAITSSIRPLLVDCGSLFRIQDRPGNGASKEPLNHCPEWIHPFVWYTYWWGKKKDTFQVSVWSGNIGRIATPWRCLRSFPFIDLSQSFWIIGPMKSRNNSWENRTLANEAQFYFVLFFLLMFSGWSFPLHAASCSNKRSFNLYYNEWQI